jgi:hypothetical protein
MQMRSAFDAVWDAEAQLLAVGVTTNVAFPHPVDEAWAAWRAKRVLREPVDKRRGRM